jgi:peptide/nickel transport system substrate-binding protein
MILNKKPPFVIRNLKRFTLLVYLLMAIISACRGPVEQNKSQATPAMSDTLISPTSTARPTPTVEEPSVLMVCTAGLPESLFLYDGISTAVKSNALALILESPLKRVNGQLQPVIIKAVPSQTNGDLRLEPVSVQAGQPVLDAAGEVVVLKPGLRLRPSGCREGACVITWDGETAIQMDQMVVVFHLNEKLTWSDGAPLIASDSVFSYRLANDPQAPGLAWAEARTQSYQALDTHTIQWVGLPGFSTALLERLFWLPQPEHRFEATVRWEDVVDDALATTTPLSYGPFVLTEYDSNHLRFEPNPYYFRSDEGLPYLDEVLFRVVLGGAESAWGMLQSGKCDLMDLSFNLAGQPSLLAEIQEDDRFDLLLQAGEVWTQLVFGIQPAVYDDGFAFDKDDRPDFFGDVRTRQAFAACLDREAMRNVILGNLGEPWPSFLPTSQSQLNADEQIVYDPTLGQQLLEAVGWIDHDQNPATPRQAAGMAGVPSGKALSVELLINDSPYHQDLAPIIQDSLAMCGVSVTVIPMPAQTLYAPGPDGLIFGRKFDLALLSWQGSSELDCHLYHSLRVPTPNNQWIGTNVAGLFDEDYDIACVTAELALPDEQAAALRAAEQGFLTALPSLPIFAPPQVMALSIGYCDREMSSSVFNLLFGIESVLGDKNCP